MQVKDTITPGHAHYNEKSHDAKTIKNAGGGIAHTDAKMTCYACHTSWMTSCSGCHLPQEQNVDSRDAALRGHRSRATTRRTTRRSSAPTCSCSA